MKCICGSADIDYQESNGNAVCCGCGRIIEENTIVSSLEFEETGDRSHVIGQFVSAEGTKPNRLNNRIRNRFSSSGESRFITLSNARRAIQQVASTLKLPLLFVDRAHNLYRLALQSHFMFGRQQTHVVATCLYTICRLEKSPNLLIDFADALQVNVYVLGKTFLQFIKVIKLQQQLQIIDPCLYLHRYACRFNLGDKLNSITTMSLRIITRMKKDWIITGRRPDSICAVALTISMRCHGIVKTQTEIARTFRIQVTTLHQRIVEFSNTPAAQLTVQEFNTMMPVNSDSMDPNSNSNQFDFDPPSFIRNLVKESAPDVSNSDIVYDFSLDSEKTYNQVICDSAQIDFGSSTSLQTVDFGTVSVKVPLPALKKRKLSALMESKSVAKMELYNHIKNIVHVDGVNIPKIIVSDNSVGNSSDGSIVNHLDKSLISAVELENYFIDEEEVVKRSAIFEKAFRVILNERQNKANDKDIQGNNQKTSHQVNVEDLKKRSSKINYEAVKSRNLDTQLLEKVNPVFNTQSSIFSESAEDIQPVIQRKTIKLGSSQNEKNNSVVSSLIINNPDVKLTNEAENEDEDLLYDNYDDDDYLDDNEY